MLSFVSAGRRGNLSAASAGERERGLIGVERPPVDRGGWWGEAQGELRAQASDRRVRLVLSIGDLAREPGRLDELADLVELGEARDHALTVGCGVVHAGSIASGVRWRVMMLMVE